MRERSGVLCVGSVVVDLAKLIDAYPPRDRIAVIESVIPSTGGPAANLAVDLARLGADYPLSIGGIVGDDSHADLLLAAFTELGIDTSGLRRDNRAVTSFTDAMVERDGGSRTFFHHRGANDLLTVADVDLDATSARILHLGAPGLHRAMDETHGWRELLQQAQQRGIRTNLELVSLPPEQLRAAAQECLPHLDSIVVNEVEAAAIVNQPVPQAGFDGASVDWDALAGLARRLIEAGVSRLAVVHFPGGAIAASPDGATWRQGSVRLPREQIRNATGAGDAFAAGVIHGLHQGWEVAESLRAGVCVAAASLHGAQTSDGIGPLAQCLSLGARYGFRVAEGVDSHR